MNDTKTPDDRPITRKDLEMIHRWMTDTEHTLRVILCCSLLPKDGPNWAYYEALFSSAEKMMSHGYGPVSKLNNPDLPRLVRDVLLGCEYDHPEDLK